jgi:hypothetical protein
MLSVRWVLANVGLLSRCDTSIVNRLLPPQRYVDDEPEPGAVYREMLLSYRLLFGKSSKSRKLPLKSGPSYQR